MSRHCGVGVSEERRWMGSPGVAGGSAGPFGDGRRGEVPGKALQRTEHPRGSCCSTAVFSAQPPKCPGSSGKFGPGCAHALLGQKSPSASAPQRGACVPGPGAPGLSVQLATGPPWLSKAAALGRERAEFLAAVGSRGLLRRARARSHLAWLGAALGKPCKAPRGSVPGMESLGEG